MRTNVTPAVWCLSVGHEREVNPAKTEEPIEMPFGVRTGTRPTNHVLGGGTDPEGKLAIFFGGEGTFPGQL